MKLSLDYLIKKPEIKKDKNPLLLLLHGYGSNAEDLFSLTTELPKHYYVISAQAPFVLQPFGYSWYDLYFDENGAKFSDDKQAIQSRELIVVFIDEILENFPIDKNDITLVGFSQGSILSYAIALSYPQKIKNVVALSGYLNQNLLQENYKNNDFSKLNFFVSHGTNDPIIPIEAARKTVDFLNDLKIKNTYLEYQMMHEVSAKNFSDLKKFINQTTL